MDSTKSTIRGYVAGLIGSLFHSVSAAFVQLLHGVIPPFELNLARYGASFIACVVIILIGKGCFRVERQFLVWVTLTIIASNTNNILYYTASSLIPLGNQVVAFQATVIVSSAFVSKFILKDRVLLTDYPLVILVLIGGVLICQSDPPFEHLNKGLCTGMRDVNFTTAADTLPCEVKQNMAFRTESALGYIFTVISGVSRTVMSWAFRSKLQDISSITINFWIGAGGIATSIGLMAYFEEPIYTIDITQGLFLIGHCVGITVCSLTQTVGFQLLTPIAISLVTSATFIFNFILQYSFPGVFLPGSRNFPEVLGAVLITSATILSAWSNVRVNRVQYTYLD